MLRFFLFFESYNTAGTPEELSIMLVKADDPAQEGMLKQTFTAAFVDYEVQITGDENNVIKEKITSGEVKCAFVMTSATTYTYYVNDLSMGDMNTEIASGILQ